MLPAVKLHARRLLAKLGLAPQPDPGASLRSGFPGPLHAKDDMLRDKTDDNLANYLQAGEEIFGHVKEILAQKDKTLSDIQTCLDLPCGYGRVLRHLCKEVSPESITACDIQKDAVEFCRAEFGVRPLVSETDFRAIRFPCEYDLIWTGSLITHLPVQKCIEALEVLAGALRKDGIFIFTTVGMETAKSYTTEVGDAGFPIGKMIEIIDRDGVCFEPYPDTPGYGLTFHTEQYIRDLIAKQFDRILELYYFNHRAWDSCQDVWACQKK